MTITQLQYVIAVAEHLNFTAAAESCHVTQPTLSMQIHKLEQQLGILIFDRSKKPISVTPVGAQVVEQAKNIVVEANRMNDIVDQFKGYVGGDYILGIIPTVMPTLLPMFLKTFVKKHPKVNLIIKELPTASLIEKLIDGQLDAAIAATPLQMPQLIERPLYYEPFVAYVPQGHRLWKNDEITTTDLAVEDVLLLQDGHCFRDGVINLCQAAASLQKDRFKIESGSFETLINLSDEGMGMTLLPYLHTLPLSDTKKPQLRHFEEPRPAREISLIYHKKELKVQISNALRETIASLVRGAIKFQDVEIISPLAKK